MIRHALLLTFLLVGAAHAAVAHEVRPGYLELREVSPGRYEVMWKHPMSGEVEIRLTPVFPGECADAGGGGSQQTGTIAVIVRTTIVCEGGIRGLTIGIEGLRETTTDVLVRIHHGDGAVETHLIRPVSPTYVVGSGSGKAASYLRLGIEHILMGVDHLLFVLGLLLIVRDRWMLLKTITSFTIAHSITLAIATLGYATAPVLPLNAAIALSILFLGPEIVRSMRGETSLTIRHPWVVAFAFGLLHGFGFASGLTTLGLPTHEIPIALLLFNVGVEIGQLFFVALILLLARSFRTLEIRWPRWVGWAPAYVVGSLGAFWFIQRTIVLLSAP
ncbi:MAG: HupE/UreJ family protein [Gemmatimonadota bacterium]|nr:MAG: HupE/UreJ family protein [Gemmatimonadota bacterium]